MSSDNTLMGVPVDTRGRTPRIGNPQPLFTAQSVRGVLIATVENLSGWGYDVTADGQRFVVI